MQEKLNTLICSFVEEHMNKPETQALLKAEFDKSWPEMLNKAFVDAMHIKAQEMANKLADSFYSQNPSSSGFTLPKVTAQEYPAEQTTIPSSIWASLEQIHPSAVVLVTLLQESYFVLSGCIIGAGEIVLRTKGGLSSFSVTLRKMPDSIWIAVFSNGISINNANKTNREFVQAITAHLNQPVYGLVK